MPWNKGLTKENNEVLNKNSKRGKGKHTSRRTEFKKGHKPLFAGWKIFSKEHRENMSKAHRGRKNPEHSKRMKELWENEGYRKNQLAQKKRQKKPKPKKLSREECGKLHSIRMKELWQDDKYIAKMKKSRGREWKIKLSKSNKGRIRTKDQIKKMLRRRIPSSLEKQFLNIINSNRLPYKYVGNGTFFIENCNPDFININGDKIAIEVYSRYYKLRNWKSIEQWKQIRKKMFDKYGWQLLFFDETQVKEPYVLGVLGE